MEYEQELIARISECSEVVGNLENNKGWSIILRDMETQRKMIDDNWHHVTDEKKLNEFRITKFAVLQILTTVQKYKDELQQATKELEKFQNPEKEVLKDFDNE